MGYKENVEQENNEIVKRLKKEGYANKIIKYAEFLEIYKIYEETMSELEFAYLLGMNYEKFRNMRTKGTKTKILVQVASEELKNNIIKKLQQSGYTNKMIDYSEFIELYKEYNKQITEKEFAKIIGITDPRYQNIKHRGGKTTILETKIDAHNIKDEIEKEYGSILINYEKFLIIYKKYKQQINNEAQFAEILGITIDNFYSMKNKGTKARILKQDEISEELKKDIQTAIIEQGYKNRLISYSEFLLLYKPYSTIITEVKFATILEITSLKYRNMKYYNSKTYVLGKSKKELTPERKKEIEKELILEGYSNKNITYSEFRKIHSNYKSEIDETQFAELIGISYTNFMTIKNQGSGAIILKTEDISEDQLQKISKDERIKKVIGQAIDYSQFIELYKPYANFMTESQFAKIIGISYINYCNLKRYRVKVDGLYAQRMRIKHIVRESRIYSPDEIKDFCEKYECNINDFFKVVCKTENEQIIDEYHTLLKSKGIFIGVKPIDDEILNKHGENIIRFIDNKSKSMGRFYRQNRYCDDVASDTIMYITQKRGDLFINFGEERALEVIKYITRKYIKYAYLSHLKLRENFSIDKINEDLGDHHTYAVNKKQNTETIAIERIITDNNNKDIYEKCINLLQYYHESGLSSSETIEKVSQELGIAAKTMLEIMKQCLLERNKIKQTSNGEYYLR